MRAMRKPLHNSGTVLRMCIGSISNHTLQANLTAIETDLLTEGVDYDRRATGGELYTIAADTRPNDEVVRGAVTKAELKDLYTSHMVTKSKPARDIYQALIDSAPLGLCPCCGFGQAETLDHYLNKTAFPQFSIFPLNLVPACMKCNFDKRDSVAVIAGEQPLHPYYDHGRFISEQWLYAEVLETAPPVIRYRVSPPEHWDSVSKERVASHFSQFRLARRFGIQATSELATVQKTLSTYCATEESRLTRLLQDGATHRSLHANCWRTAMYQALASSDWYCREGYAVG